MAASTANRSRGLPPSADADADPRPHRLLRHLTAIAALLTAAVLAAPAAADRPPPRCGAGSSVPVLAGKRALLVRRARAVDGAVLSACRRGSRHAVTLGATYGDDVSTNPRTRSTLVGAAIGGDVVAAGFEVLDNGCLYAHGCGDAPRQVLRVADTRALTLRRIPLHGSLDAVSAGADGRVTFRVDEYACLSEYRTGALPGAAVQLVSRVPVRVTPAGGEPLCAVPAR